MPLLKIPLGIQIHVEKQVVSATGMHSGKQMLATQMSSWPRVDWQQILSVCCGGEQGDRIGMKDREEQVTCGICTPSQQDEASYDSTVREDQGPSRGQRRRKDGGDGGQGDKHS